MYQPLHRLYLPTFFFFLIFTWALTKVCGLTFTGKSSFGTATDRKAIAATEQHHILYVLQQKQHEVVVQDKHT